MATTAEFIRRLKKAGFRLAEHNKKHDLYVNDANGRSVHVWRHAKEIKNGTYYAMLRDAGLGDEN